MDLTSTKRVSHICPWWLEPKLIQVWRHRQPLELLRREGHVLYVRTLFLSSNILPVMTNFQTVTAETVSILSQWNNVVCHLGGLLVNMQAENRSCRYYAHLDRKVRVLSRINSLANREARTQMGWLLKWIHTPQKQPCCRGELLLRADDEILVLFSLLNL